MQKTKKNEGQLSLDHLLDDGELHQLEFSSDDIGGELLAVLTKGLYTNSMDCIREYVQNAVDAGANNVKIKITGNSVLIRDDGRGMNLEDLLQARQFGLSYKSITEHVGFRGIGIYSGFDLCQSLRLTTKKQGEERQYIIVFEFDAMKKQLDRDRNSEVGSSKTPLLKLLSDYTFIKREPSNLPLDEGFSLVELQNIDDFHIKSLEDRSQLRMYLLRNLPVDFADTFEHKTVINQHLLRNVPGYHPIKIDLESDAIEDEKVDKYDGLVLQPPTFGTLINGSNQIGFYWACMTSENEQIERGVEQEDKKYAGFVYKVKGFTIGDRGNPATAFAKRTHMYQWYTGEIYILDPNVIPTAERNDFEANAAKQNLELAFRIEVDTKLLKDVLKFQAETRAKEILDRSVKEVSNISNWLSNSQVDSKSKSYASEWAVYSELDKIVDNLKKQKNGLVGDERKQADELLKTATRMQGQVVKDVKNATPQNAKKKREAKKELVQPIPSEVEFVSTAPVPKTLSEILNNAGWSIEGETRLLVGTIQSSLEDVLGSTSFAYRTLLDHIDAKINDELSA